MASEGAQASFVVKGNLEFVQAIPMRIPIGRSWLSAAVQARSEATPHPIEGSQTARSSLPSD